MSYEIVTYGASVLREKAEPVGVITDELRKLAEAMLETMYASNGAGLAAEQIGRTEAICVIDVSGRPDDDDPAPASDVPMPLILVNPRITGSEGRQVGQEGCLSFPEIFVNIERAEWARVVFTDLDGRECEIEATGLLARAVQHELDHLNGVLLVDRMTPVQKIALSGKLKRLRKSRNRGFVG